MAIIGSFHKQPGEQLPFGVEYAGRLPAGATLVSGILTVRDEAGTDVSATLLSSTTAVVSGTQLLGRIRAGTAVQLYKITVLATLSTGGTPPDVLEDDIVMVVSNT